MKYVSFPRWAEILCQSNLPSKTREGYLVTIRWYLSWCREQGTGCTIGSARAFMDWAVAEKKPTESIVELWRASVAGFPLVTP